MTRDYDDHNKSTLDLNIISNLHKYITYTYIRTHMNFNYETNRLKNSSFRWLLLTTSPRKKTFTINILSKFEHHLNQGILFLFKYWVETLFFRWFSSSLSRTDIYLIMFVGSPVVLNVIRVKTVIKWLITTKISTTTLRKHIVLRCDYSFMTINIIIIIRLTLKPSSFTHAYTFLRSCVYTI